MEVIILGYIIASSFIGLLILLGINTYHSIKMDNYYKYESERNFYLSYLDLLNKMKDEDNEEIDK